MATEQKDYYASRAWLKITLISTIGIFCLAFWFLFRGLVQANIYWGLPFFIVNFLLGLGAIYHYLKSRYLPLAQVGHNWIIVKQGSRNRRSFTAKSRIKDIKILKSDLDFVRKGLFSTIICTKDGSRYFIYGLAAHDTEDLVQRLLSE